MLKFIYKTLLVSVLSCSLLMLDFSYKGIMVNSVQAETLKTEGVKDADLMATLTMTAVGLLASRLYSCKLTPDMMVAAAGGAAFIAGEILSTIKLKKVMKDLETEITRDPNGNVNKEQVQALERLRKSYEEAKKTAGTKKMLQMAAAAAFAAAAVLAYTQYGTNQGLDKTCTMALTAAANTCNATGKPMLSNPYTAAQGAILVSGATQTSAASPKLEATAAAADVPGAPSAKMQTTETTMQAADKVLVTTASGQCPATGGANGICASGHSIKMATRGVCMVPPVLSSIPQAIGHNLYAYAPYSHVNSTNNTFSMIQQMFMANAHADLFSPMGIVSSAAISFVLLTSKTLGVQIDTFLFSPMNRAIIWGVLAGLSFAASSATDNVIKKIESNIAKIDAILNSMYSLGKGSGTENPAKPQAPGVNGTTKPSTITKMNPTNYEDMDLSELKDGTLPCFTGADTKNCKSFEEVNKTLPAFTSLDLPTQQQVSGILKTANGVNGTSKISGTTLDGLARLAASANALKAASDKAKNKIQDRFKLDKKKTNLDAISKKFEDDLNAAVSGQLKKSNTNAADMMASLYGGRGGIASSSDSAVAKTGEDADASKLPPAVANVIDIGAGASSDPANAGLDGIDTGSGSAMSAAELAAYNEAAKKTNLDGFDVPTNDISHDSSASIFDLISNRYQQSGYPRLFKVKEPVPVKK